MRTQLATVELAGNLRAIAIDRSYDWVRVLVCDHGSPLGELHFRAKDFDGEVPVHHLQSTVDSAFGWENWKHALRREFDPDPQGPALPPVTVAVCTKDRPESLKRCLAALGEMDYPRYEVLVVDNASSDPGIRDIVEAGGGRYVSEPRVGLDRARNAAIRNAAHDLVAFCDDDVQVSRRWLHGVARGFADPHTAVVTGLVLPAELETPAQSAFERYGGMAKGFRRFTVDHALLGESELFTSSRWGVGANMAFRRHVAEAVGLFDPGLDVGTPSGGGGDIEMLWRVVAAGHRLRYEPDAWVRHAHRRDAASLVRQIEANGQSYGCFLRTIAERTPSLKSAVDRHTRAWVRGWLLREVARTVKNRDRFAARLAWAELRGARRSGAAYRRTRETGPLT